MQWSNDYKLYHAINGIADIDQFKTNVHALYPGQAYTEPFISGIVPSNASVWCLKQKLLDAFCQDAGYAKFLDMLTDC